MQITSRLFPCLALVFSLAACSPASRLAKLSSETFDDPALRNAHVGISLVDAATGLTLYDHQGDKYFVPASNTKIPTCYAGMQFLGDSILAFHYSIGADSTIAIRPAGDPTFLHPDFLSQRTFDFLKKFKAVEIHPAVTEGLHAYGSGWSWNDYLQGYMPPRSQMPIYGNMARFEKFTADSVRAVPHLFGSRVLSNASGIAVSRPFDNNQFTILPGEKSLVTTVPFYPDSIVRFLQDTLRRPVRFTLLTRQQQLWQQPFFSQRTDSLLKIMMHRSDNFFAEQVLLMVGHRMLNRMNERMVIDTLKKTILAGLPQEPRWVDGSGLSRYNLFTPQDFTHMLRQMQQQFGMERLKEIFPSGNEGTLTNYYTSIADRFYAKTGTLSGVVALSGYMYSKKNKLLLFSVQVNNHNGSATAVRRAVEKLLLQMANAY